MRRSHFLLLIPLLLGAACIVVNLLLVPLPAARTSGSGAVLLLSLFLFVFTLVRARRPD